MEISPFAAGPHTCSATVSTSPSLPLFAVMALSWDSAPYLTVIERTAFDSWREQIVKAASKELGTVPLVLEPMKPLIRSSKAR